MMSEQKPAPNATTSSNHVIALEEKIMFQQRTLEELNAVVLKQQDELDRLGRELKSLQSTMLGLVDRGVGEDLPHEKPPHY